jgi:pimeloyl-ACP methyl ester carboxylesterase
MATATLDERTCNAEAGNHCRTKSLAPLTLIRARFQREARHDICDTGRYRCPYHIWGNGPDLLFIPGLCDDALAFVQVMSILNDYFRCIAYDLPAGGSDGACLASYRHEDLVADVSALVEHVGAHETVLYGSSFGATIALAALYQQPKRFSGAILQGGFARRPLAPAEVMLAKFARYWPWPLRRLPGWLPLVTHAHASPFAGRAAEVWQFFLERSGHAPMAAVARRALMLHHADVRPLLRGISQPVLMLCGDTDPLVGKNCESELLLGLPHVTRAELAHCGHLPQFTHPELVADLVEHFLMPESCATTPCENRSLP